MNGGKIKVAMEEAANEWDAWRSVFAFSAKPGDSTEKRYLGTRSPRVCRFCGRSRPATTFRSEAHVIPAAFGNRRLFSLDECDECNSDGSALEDDLAKYLSLPRAISRLPGRKGNPKIRHPNEKSFIQGDRATNKVSIYQSSDDEGVSLTDNPDGTVQLRIKTPRYRPANVARALGRMLLFGLDLKEPGFDRIRSWIRRETDWFPIPLLTLHFPNSGYNVVRLLVHRQQRVSRRSILRVGFLYSSFLTVMPVPMDEWSVPPELPLINFPPEIAPTMLANSSPQFVTDDEPVCGHFAEANLTYSQRSVRDKEGGL